MAEIVAFTAEHVSRLTGLTPRQLRYWDTTDFFEPTYLTGHQRRAFGRVYSFRDVVGLRAIAILRKEHRVSLQELRRLGAWLRKRHEAPWSSVRFAVAGGKVFAIDPRTGQATEPRGAGQADLTVALEPIAIDLLREVHSLTRRRAEQIGHISGDRYVLRNAPVLAGTRIPTRAVWNLAAAGLDSTAIIREYPSLTEADVKAALSFERGRHEPRLSRR
jgi:DNA-binding transcriptional MerR regulator